MANGRYIACFHIALACVIFGLIFFGLLGIIVFTLAILVGVAFHFRTHLF